MTVTATGSVLGVEKLRKVYRGRAVVDGVDLELRQGEVVGLLGPNGAGKTTTFYMIVGFIAPDAGGVSTWTAATFRVCPCTNGPGWASGICRRNRRSSGG